MDGEEKRAETSRKRTRIRAKIEEETSDFSAQNIDSCARNLDLITYRRRNIVKRFIIIKKEDKESFLGFV